MDNKHSWPFYDQDEIDAVQKVLAAGQVNYWTGTEGRNFEKEFAVFCDARHAIALSNGTVALELALRALDVGPGDEVIVTPRTFIASVSSIVMVGATPVFADVDVDSQNITPETVRRVITEKTRAVLAVHLAGWPCDMDGLMELANQYNLKVIEDCAQAHGAVYKGKPVGTIGHVAAWSFCQDKIMTTGGEGGMLTTNDAALWEKAWAFKDHGKSWDAVYNCEHPPGFRWLHESFGTNWRMTEMQSAIGRIQIRKMPDWHEARKRNAQALIEICEKHKEALRVPLPPADVEHAWYKFYVFVRQDGLKDGWDRDRIMSEINNNGIPCFSGSCSEVYLEKAFDGSGFRPEQRLPVAQELGERSLMFLIHPTLTPVEIQKTCEVLDSVLRQSKRN